MFSFIVAHSVIGAVKALPNALHMINAGLDILLGQQAGEARAVVDVSIGVSARELNDLMADTKFRGAIHRGEMLKRSGVKPVSAA